MKETILALFYCLCAALAVQRVAKVCGTSVAVGPTRRSDCGRETSTGEDVQLEDALKYVAHVGDEVKRYYGGFPEKSEEVEKIVEYLNQLADLLQREDKTRSLSDSQTLSEGKRDLLIELQKNLASLEQPTDENMERGDLRWQTLQDMISRLGNGKI